MEETAYRDGSLDAGRHIVRIADFVVVAGRQANPSIRKITVAQIVECKTEIEVMV